MKITDRFIADHKAFRKIIGDIENISMSPIDDAAHKKLSQLLALLTRMLLTHASMEDTFYFPAVRAALPTHELLITEAYIELLFEEHRRIDGYLKDLDSQINKPKLMPVWEKTFELFVDALSSHTDKEETELFPFSEGLLGSAALEKMSRDVEMSHKKG